MLVAFAGAFVFDVADRQPQQLDYRVIGREMAAVLCDFAQLVVQRFDGVGRVLRARPDGPTAYHRSKWAGRPGMA